MAEGKARWTQSESDAIRGQLNRIVRSDLFAQGNRQCRFLEFIVEETLTGRADQLNQILVGVEVFDRDESFDPAIDSIVRVEAGRLRSKLAEYYSAIGKDDPILITLPKGGYRVLIHPKSSQISIGAPTSERAPTQLNIGIVLLFLGLVVGGAYFGISISRQSATTEDDSGTATVSKNGGAGAFEGPTQRIERDDGKPAIAILPFDNMSTDPEQSYFSDGITEDIITDLSMVSGLTVIARHSSFVYKGQSISVREIGQNLGVRYVLEGSVRKAGDQLRITAQLIDAMTETHVWADRYDRNLDDVFAIQDEVSRMIVSALEVKLTDLEQNRLGHVGTETVEAHDYFLRAREQYYLFTIEGINNAIDLFSESIELDQNYAEAYAWKSRVYVYAFVAGINNSKEETIDPALALARRAVELDDLLPMAHASLGWTLRWSSKIEEAVSEIGTALEIDSNHADGYLWQSLILSSAGRGQEALASVEKGILINPNYGVAYLFGLGRAYFILGQDEAALIHFNRGIDRNPNFVPNLTYKMFVLERLGRNEESDAAKDELTRIYPDYESSASYLTYADEQRFVRQTK